MQLTIEHSILNATPIFERYTKDGCTSSSFYYYNIATHKNIVFMYTHVCIIYITFTI